MCSTPSEKGRDGRAFRALQQRFQGLTILRVGAGFLGVKGEHKPVPPLSTTMLSVVDKSGQKSTGVFPACGSIRKGQRCVKTRECAQFAKQGSTQGGWPDQGDLFRAVVAEDQEGETHANHEPDETGRCDVHHLPINTMQVSAEQRTTAHQGERERERERRGRKDREKESEIDGARERKAGITTPHLSRWA